MPRPRGVGGSAEGAALMPVHESDVCIIGGGISAAMLALKLSELRPGISITVIEAGSKLFDLENRMRYRQRSIEYAENPWPGDFIEDQTAKGVISRTMAVGGSALHWGGTCNRFSEEDLRLKSMFGLYTDWPIEWAELEKFYCEAEQLFQKLAQSANGKILSTGAGNYLDHPAGGCRMGADPATSVCDSFGQTHDHENL